MKIDHCHKSHNFFSTLSLSRPALEWVDSCPVPGILAVSLLLEDKPFLIPKDDFLREILWLIKQPLAKLPPLLLMVRSQFLTNSNFKGFPLQLLFQYKEKSYVKLLGLTVKKMVRQNLK